MASVVDICNLALAHLGDTATVASIDPPEGSAQAEHCQRFYPIARDSLLEMHMWNFSTVRANLALLNITMPEWAYIYAAPNDMLQAISVLPPEASDDYSARIMPVDAYGYTTIQNLPFNWAGTYTPQPFAMETSSDGTQVICTDQQNAVLRYTKLVTDTSQFSPLFTMALSWHLASMLAGPIIKGDVGAAEAKRCAQMMMVYLSQAEQSDANQRNIKPNQIVGWMAGR